jgi:fucose 4-O-acetylase-like acetyltransferase
MIVPQNPIESTGPGTTSQTRRSGDTESVRRVQWIDFAKGIGIFLVVLGHALGGMSSTGLLSAESGYAFGVRWIYHFHMPLFFFLAGLVAGKSAKRRFFPYVADKASVIMYPYVVWSLITGAAQHFAGQSANHPLPWSRLLEITYNPIDQYWFLYVIFIMYMIYWVLNRAGQAGLPLLVASVLICIGNTVAPNPIQWDVANSVASLLIYFASGGVLAGTGVFRRAAALPSTSLLAITMCGYGLVAVDTISGNAWDAIQPAVAAIGVGSTAALAIATSRWRSVGFLQTWGLYSLEIYVAHTIFSAGMRTVLLKMGQTDLAEHVLAGTAMGIYLPMLLAAASAKLRYPYLFTFTERRVKR